MAERKWEGAGEGERGRERNWKHVAVEEAKAGSVPRSSTAPHIGRQAPRPLQEAPGQWSDEGGARGPQEAALLSSRKSQNPGSACLGSGPQRFTGLEPNGQGEDGDRSFVSSDW